MVAQFFEGWGINCAGSGPTPGVAPCEESSAEPVERATETETVECLKADKKENGRAMWALLSAVSRIGFSSAL